MRPALGIFRKDVLHLWPRIAIVLAVELLLGCVSFWPPPGFASTRYLLGLFEILAWWYLIAVVIHEEAVPGNRQYWLTRPISRQALLAAKVIFMLVFLCLPLLLGQVASLVLRGRSPVAYLPEILVIQLFFLAKVVLPAVALASITAGLVEFVWTPLAALAGLYVTGIPLVLWLLPRSELDWGGLEWFRTTVVAVLALAASAAILLVQYVRRQTRLSRGILAAALLIGVFLAWMPGWHMAFALQTRLGGQHVADTVARIAFDPARDPRTRPTDGSEWPGQNVYGIAIPVRITGIPDGMALYSDRATVSVETPAGRRWNSGWDSLNRLFRALGRRGASMEEGRFLPGDGEYWLYLNIDRSFYRPVHLHASVALTLLSAERIAPLALREGAQAVSNDGFCWATSRILLVETACSWPVRTPARSEFRSRPGGTSLGLRSPVGSYGPYPTSVGLWQWAGQVVTTDPSFWGMDLVTRVAVAHFERDLDIPALGAWGKQ